MKLKWFLKLKISSVFDKQMNEYLLGKSYETANKKRLDCFGVLDVKKNHVSIYMMGYYSQGEESLLVLLLLIKPL